MLPGKCPAPAFAGISLPRGPCDSASSAFPVFWGNCVLRSLSHCCGAPANAIFSRTAKMSPRVLSPSTSTCSFVFRREHSIVQGAAKNWALGSPVREEKQQETGCSCQQHPLGTAGGTPFPARGLLAAWALPGPSALTWLRELGMGTADPGLGSLVEGRFKIWQPPPWVLAVCSSNLWDFAPMFCQRLSWVISDRREQSGVRAGIALWLVAVFLLALSPPKRTLLVPPFRRVLLYRGPWRRRGQKATIRRTKAEPCPNTFPSVGLSPALGRLQRGAGAGSRAVGASLCSSHPGGQPVLPGPILPGGSARTILLLSHLISHSQERCCLAQPSRSSSLGTSVAQSLSQWPGPRCPPVKAPPSGALLPSLSLLPIALMAFWSRGVLSWPRREYGERAEQVEMGLSQPLLTPGTAQPLPELRVPTSPRPAARQAGECEAGSRLCAPSFPLVPRQGCFASFPVSILRSSLQWPGVCAQDRTAPCTGRALSSPLPALDARSVAACAPQ